MGDFELIKQQDQSDCGVACLAMILAAFQSRIPLYKLRQISGTDKQGTSALGLIKAMEEYSIDCLPIQADNQVWNDEEMSYPAIAHIINEEQMMHYVVVYDDVFAQYDDGRAKNGLTMLAELSEQKGDHQILLFTCHQRIADWGAEIEGVTVNRQLIESQ